VNPIVIPCYDPIIHTAQNDYRCWDITCPCHESPLWTGALMSIERSTTAKQKAVRKQGVPTDVLPRYTGTLPEDLQPGGATWRVETPQRRKRAGLWHRIKGWFSFESVTEAIEGFNVGVSIVLGVALLLTMLLWLHR
jgi:hypothetical protein